MVNRLCVCFIPTRNALRSDNDGNPLSLYHVLSRRWRRRFVNLGAHACSTSASPSYCMYAIYIFKSRVKAQVLRESTEKCFPMAWPTVTVVHNLCAQR